MQLSITTLRQNFRLILALGALIALVGGVGFFVSRVAAATPAPLYVDITSKGGQCSDTRTAAQVTVTQPLCTIDKAMQIAPDGVTVSVRAGTYPRLAA